MNFKIFLISGITCITTLLGHSDKGRIHYHPHPDETFYEWSNIDGKVVAGKFIRFSYDTMELTIENRLGTRFDIKFDSLSEKSQQLVKKIKPEKKPQPVAQAKPEPKIKFVPENVAQQILLDRIERLERVVIELDQKNKNLENRLNLRLVKNKQTATNPFEDFGAAHNRQVELERMQEQMEIIKFNQMSGADILIP